jgi:hypothetical protein
MKGFAIVVIFHPLELRAGGHAVAFGDDVRWEDLAALSWAPQYPPRIFAKWELPDGVEKLLTAFEDAGAIVLRTYYMREDFEHWWTQ